MNINIFFTGPGEETARKVERIARASARGSTEPGAFAEFDRDLVAAARQLEQLTCSVELRGVEVANLDHVDLETATRQLDDADVIVLVLRSRPASSVLIGILKRHVAKCVRIDDPMDGRDLTTEGWLNAIPSLAISELAEWLTNKTEPSISRTLGLVRKLLQQCADVRSEVARPIVNKDQSRDFAAGTATAPSPSRKTSIDNVIALADVALR
ncbi:MAG: hypothetical protein JSS20_09390 [Proteobacteria bacterium]|nr:hypothetical protein [Pseudomonadota bacterium]